MEVIEYFLLFTKNHSNIDGKTNIVPRNENTDHPLTSFHEKIEIRKMSKNRI